MKKNLLLLLVFSLPMLALGQEQGEKMSPKQKATLHSKKLSLKLGLSEQQENKVLKLILANQPKEEMKKPKGELSTDERYELQIKHLDAQKKFQNELKEILTKEQFERWLKMPKRQMHMKSKHKKHEKHPKAKKGRKSLTL